MTISRLACPFAISTVFCFLAAAAAAVKASDTELAKITERGILLAEYDTIAGRATDALQAEHPAGGRLRLYIARKTDEGWVVDFGRLNSAQDKFLVAYEAIQVGTTAKMEVRSFDPTKEESGWNLSAAKAIETAIKAFGAMGRPYNIAVLPAKPDGVYVYLYPAQLESDVYLLGADVRYHISADGARIIEKRQLHKTIIESRPVRNGVKAIVGSHTHILSDVPEDTDVLLVLARKPQVPEIVFAGAYMFTIDIDGRISVEDRPH